MIFGLGFISADAARADRIKDISVVHGVRGNQLFGYGLVTGLMGTGDTNQARFTVQSLASMLGRMGVRIDPKRLQVRNVAAVLVTAELPPFVRSGARIDVVISSLGNCRSLKGGTLVLTPLKAVDGKIYAVAQGQLLLGGYSAGGSGGGSGGGSSTKNHTTVARIPQGAFVEREVILKIQGDSLQLDLVTPDFTTAARITSVVNKEMKANVAKAIDPGTIELSVPADSQGDLVSLIARIEHLEVIPDSRARVVINERTGTVVMGDRVRISTVAISHGNLHIEVQPQMVVSQPEPFSSGQTVVSGENQINVEEERGPVRLVEKTATLGDVVKALNAMGATPRDLIEILQAIRAAGALSAKLEIL
jgi:flagellar P-ring protein precursor FlgI